MKRLQTRRTITHVKTKDSIFGVIHQDLYELHIKQSQRDYYDKNAIPKHNIPSFNVMD